MNFVQEQLISAQILSSIKLQLFIFKNAFSSVHYHLRSNLIADLQIKKFCLFKKLLPVAPTRSVQLIYINKKYVF